MKEDNAEGKDQKRSPPSGDRQDAFQRFAELAKRLVRVPKREVGKKNVASQSD